MSELKILGINVLDRIKEAGRTQQLLSQYAANIKTRLGFHELSNDVCSRNGFIILELQGETEKCDQLENELKEIGGIHVQNMTFKFD